MFWLRRIQADLSDTCASICRRYGFQITNSKWILCGLKLNSLRETLYPECILFGPVLDSQPRDDWVMNESWEFDVKANTKQQWRFFKRFAAWMMNFEIPKMWARKLRYTMTCLRCLRICHVCHQRSRSFWSGNASCQLQSYQIANCHEHTEKEWLLQAKKINRWVPTNFFN